MALFLPDANTLIHALRKQVPDHTACRQWLLDAAGYRHTIGLAELVEVALLRIPTLPKLRLVTLRCHSAFACFALFAFPFSSV